MAYIATMNTPGYLPMDDEPPVFDTASEAWAYLATERKQAEDDADYPDDDPADMRQFEYTDTVANLRRLADTDPDGPDWPLVRGGSGVVYGGTPGGSPNDIHDLGVAYGVVFDAAALVNADYA